MTGSLRALLTGSIDYAGVFPPAGLALELAIAKYRQYRDDRTSWMLGRFVVPAAQLADLAANYELERDGRLTIVVPGADTGKALLKDLDQVLTIVKKFPVAGAIEMLDFRWPAELVQDSDASRLENFVQAAAGQIVASRLSPITMYFELPRRQTPVDNTACNKVWVDQIRASVGALAEYNKTARTLNCPAGLKLRCGGTEPGEIPSPADVAIMICACRDCGINWKATAGLHHPFRHIDPAWHVPVPGFLNLFCAAVLAGVHGFDERGTQAVLDEDDNRQFKFSDEALVWRDCAIPAEHIAAARERSLRSFGSCSFDEPCQSLKVLGFV